MRMKPHELSAFRFYAASQGTTMSELVCGWIGGALAGKEPAGAGQVAPAASDGEYLRLMSRQVELLEALVSLQQVGLSSLTHARR